MSILVVGESIPSVPQDFQRQLAAFDPDLYVCWHKSPFSKQPGRWKIERCARHFGGFVGGKPVHDHTCDRVYVAMVQDDEGTPLPLGEHVFNKLRAMRANWEALGGDSERGIRNALAESDRIEQEQAAKREANVEDVKKYNRKYNRVTFNRLGNLIEQHDLRPNK